jgi:hypothetical protein
MSDELEWLQEWYIAQCNEDWEHSYGIRIDTLDNPGWRVEIDLSDTSLSEAIAEGVLVERSEHDWIYCEIKDEKFRGSAGPRGLREIISVFRSYVQGGTAIK